MMSRDITQHLLFYFLPTFIFLTLLFMALQQYCRHALLSSKINAIR
jgi:hypothetical protein